MRGVDNHLLCPDHIEGEVVVLAPHGQVSDLLPIGCLVVVGDQAYHCWVICKLNDGVGLVLGHAVKGEQGVQGGTVHTPPRGPRVEDQHGRCVGGGRSGSAGSSCRGSCLVPVPLS